MNESVGLLLLDPDTPNDFAFEVKTNHPFSNGDQPSMKGDG